MMTDTLNITLGGLHLGPVALVNLADFPLVEKSPFHNSLQVHHQGAKLHLRHRAPPQKTQREQAYELELGVVLAASAIVFASPMATVPKEMTLLLLLQKSVIGLDEAAEPQLVLIAPSRDGNDDLARPVDAEQQQSLLDAVRQQEIKLAPTPNHQTDVIDLVRTALLTGAYEEIDLPLNGQALLDIAVELPLELNFDTDGLFYFRDAMNGEDEFLFSHQSDIRAASVEISVTDGQLFLLEDDEHYLDADDGNISGGFSTASIDLEKAEDFFSRLVVQLAEEAEKADLGIEIVSRSQVIVATNIVIYKIDDEADSDLMIDDRSGLPDDEMLVEEAPGNDRLTAVGRVLREDEELTEDLLQAPPDVL